VNSKKTRMGNKGKRKKRSYRNIADRFLVVDPNKFEKNVFILLYLSFD